MAVEFGSVYQTRGSDKPSRNGFFTGIKRTIENVVFFAGKKRPKTPPETSEQKQKRLERAREAHIQKGAEKVPPNHRSHYAQTTKKNPERT